MSEVRGADPRLSILDMPVPIHPGEYVREEVLPKFKNSLENAAHHIGVASTYLQTLIEEKTDLTITVDKPPAQAGIDPVDKLIDRNPDDNLIAVKKR